MVKSFIIKPVLILTILLSISPSCDKSVYIDLYNPLGIPVIISATDNTTFIRIEWDPVSGADGYYVEWTKDINGSPSAYTMIADVSGTSYDHIGAFPQSINWYRIQAYTNNGAVSDHGTAMSSVKTGTVNFTEDWEDGVWNDTWIGDPMIDTIDVESIAGYYVPPGNQSLSITDNGDNWNYFDGLHYEFPGGIQPGYIRFYLRKDWDQNSYPWINFGDDNTAVNRGAIFFRWEGDMEIEGGGIVFASHNVFHLVEFRNINFSAQTYDFYVDSTLITADVPFYNSVASFTRLYISVGWWSQKTYIDKIEIRY